MIGPIHKGILFLGQNAEQATMADLQVAYDFLDTLKAQENECGGMAANMIRVNKVSLL